MLLINIKQYIIFPHTYSHTHLLSHFLYLSFNSPILITGGKARHPTHNNVNHVNVCNMILFEQLLLLEVEHFILFI